MRPIETLESRRHLSATADPGEGVSWFVSPRGVLHVRGTDGDDRVALRRDGDVLRVVASTRRMTADGERFVPVSVDDGVSRSRLRAVQIHGGGGDDLVVLGPRDLPAHLRGDAGDDTLGGGRAGDVIYGGEGDDRLSGGTTGNDTLYGEAGNDELFIGLGRSAIAGGAGDDTLAGAAGTPLSFTAEGKLRVGTEAVETSVEPRGYLPMNEVEAFDYDRRGDLADLTIYETLPSGQFGFEVAGRERVGDVLYVDVAKFDLDARVPGDVVSLPAFRVSEVQTTVDLTPPDPVREVVIRDAATGGVLTRFDAAEPSFAFRGNAEPSSEYPEFDPSARQLVGSPRVLLSPRGVLHVIGSDLADEIGFDVADGRVTPRVVSGGRAFVDASFALADVRAVQVDARRGSDVIDTAGLGRPTYVDAGAGDDRVTTGRRLTTVIGGEGRDAADGDAIYASAADVEDLSAFDEVLETGSLDDVQIDPNGGSTTVSLTKNFPTTFYNLIIESARRVGRTWQVEVVSRPPTFPGLIEPGEVYPDTATLRLDTRPLGRVPGTAAERLVVRDAVDGRVLLEMSLLRD